MFKKSLIAVASLVAAVGTAQACSTLIIGKNVSETGNIIVAHNEDNGGRLFNLQHYIPAAKHKKGEMLKFEKFAAEIPQVEETLGIYWTQNFVRPTSILLRRRLPERRRRHGRHQLVR